MKIFLLIVILSISLPGLVFAARLAPNNATTPKLEPLQPIPLDAQPNFSENIERQESIAQEEPLNSTGEIVLNDLPETQQIQANNKEPIYATWWFWLMVVLVLGGSFGVYYYKFNQQK